MGGKLPRVGGKIPRGILPLGDKLPRGGKMNWARLIFPIYLYRVEGGGGAWGGKKKTQKNP